MRLVVILLPLVFVGMVCGRGKKKQKQTEMIVTKLETLKQHVSEIHAFLKNQPAECNNECPNRHMSSCYWINENRLSWYDAEANCKRNGGYLAEVTSAEETDFLVGTVIKDKRVSYWIGGSKHNTDGKFMWERAGTEVGDQFWGPGEPSGDGKCLHYYSGHSLKFNDVACGNQYRFICESDMSKQE